MRLFTDQVGGDVWPEFAAESDVREGERRVTLDKTSHVDIEKLLSGGREGWGMKTARGRCAPRPSSEMHTASNNPGHSHTQAEPTPLLSHVNSVAVTAREISYTHLEESKQVGGETRGQDNTLGVSRRTFVGCSRKTTVLFLILSFKWLLEFFICESILGWLLLHFRIAMGRPFRSPPSASQGTSESDA